MVYVTLQTDISALLCHCEVSRWRQRSYSWDSYESWEAQEEHRQRCCPWSLFLWGPRLSLWSWPWHWRSSSWS